MSTVKINQGAINRFFERNPLAGAGVRGLGGGQSERIVARMITLVQAEIRKDYQSRSGELLESLRPVIRPDPRGGVRLGVGSVTKVAEYLTEGTPRHPIMAVNAPFLRSEPSVPEKWKLRKSDLTVVDHPGNDPNDFIRRGVNAAIGRPTL